MICIYCESKEADFIVSSESSTYAHCNNCKEKHMKDTLKHVAIDNLLNRLMHILEIYKGTTLKIEIKRNENFIELLVNDVYISKEKLETELSNNDIYYLENSIFELIDDCIECELIDTDVLVCT